MNDVRKNCIYCGRRLTGADFSNTDCLDAPDKAHHVTRQPENSGSESWEIQTRDWRQDRWRVVFHSIDKGEARFGLFNYVMENPGRIVRVLAPEGYRDE